MKKTVCAALLILLFTLLLTLLLTLTFCWSADAAVGTSTGIDVLLER